MKMQNCALCKGNIGLRCIFSSFIFQFLNQVIAKLTPMDTNYGFWNLNALKHTDCLSLYGPHSAKFIDWHSSKVRSVNSICFKIGGGARISLALASNTWELNTSSTLLLDVLQL